MPAPAASASCAACGRCPRATAALRPGAGPAATCPAQLRLQVLSPLVQEHLLAAGPAAQLASPELPPAGGAPSLHP